MSDIDRVINIKNKLKEIEDNNNRALGQLDAIKKDMIDKYNIDDLDSLKKKKDELEKEKTALLETFNALLNEAETIIANNENAN